MWKWGGRIFDGCMIFFSFCWRGGGEEVVFRREGGGSRGCGLLDVDVVVPSIVVP